MFLVPATAAHPVYLHVHTLLDLVLVQVLVFVHVLLAPGRVTPCMSKHDWQGASVKQPIPGYIVTAGSWQSSFGSAGALAWGMLYL